MPCSEERSQLLGATTPPPNVPVPVRCDACGVLITSKARLDHYADGLGVDWALCAGCEWNGEGKARR
jgi:hypothetical protein